MTSTPFSPARAVADLSAGQILASVEIAAPPERVFAALASKEIVNWWVRPGVFDVREWTGEIRCGGRWRASGIARGEPYTLEGEYLEVEPPTRLVHTWHRVGAAGGPTTVTYQLERINGGTRLTLKHIGIASREACNGACGGWETSFDRLSEILSAGRAVTGGPKSAATPQARAVSYFDALRRKNRAAIREMLMDNGHFIGPLQSFTQADAFMSAADVFMQLVRTVEIKKVLADGDDVAIFWDYTTIVPSIPVIPVAAWLTIEADKIKYLHLHFNPAAFVAAAERGDVARALQGPKPASVC